MAVHYATEKSSSNSENDDKNLRFGNIPHPVFIPVKDIFHGCVARCCASKDAWDHHVQRSEGVSAVLSDYRELVDPLRGQSDNVGGLSWWLAVKSYKVVVDRYAVGFCAVSVEDRGDVVEG